MITGIIASYVAFISYSTPKQSLWFSERVRRGTIFQDPSFKNYRDRKVSMVRSGNMKMKIVLAFALLAGVTSPAWADFYVVQDVKTKKCTIVDQKPTTTTTVTQVGPLTFKTRQEAETGMKKEKICVEK